MRVLLAIVSCHELKSRRDSIRATWLPLVPEGLDYKFFIGEPSRQLLRPNEEQDVVQLPVDDSYRGLPSKSSAICRWAYSQGYDYVVKCDDDVYLQPGRLLSSNFENMGDYIGRKRGPSGHKPGPYASGFCYVLSNKTMKIVAGMKLDNDPAEDRCVGNALLEAGIECTPDYRYVVTASEKCALSSNEGPRQGNSVIASCEHGVQGMMTAHDEWLHAPAGANDLLPRGPFEKVCILMKTFLRDGFLLKSVQGVLQQMPSAKIVIVDDGRESNFKISWYSNMRRSGHVAAWLPFDSGFGAKANHGVGICDRPYVLIASDDFNFDDPKASVGVQKLVEVLDVNPEVSIASGRVNSNPYEADLEIVGDECFEKRAQLDSSRWSSVTPGGARYYKVDLTVNYSLIRREVFDKCRWDGGEVKIGGGEHGAFYLDLKQEGFTTVYVEGVNVNELKGTTDWSSAEYHKYRARARTPGRSCLRRRGINKFHLMGGGFELT